jgi:hypothetical protein
VGSGGAVVAARLALPLALALGCHRAAPPAPRDAMAPDAPATTTLDDHAVDDRRPWRAVLYSWTPPAQAAMAARDGVLLRTSADDGAATPFSELLARLGRRAGDDGAVARALLRDPSLRRYRYAWASGFATARGFQGRSYGSSLVRVTLRPDALMLCLDPSDPRPWRIVDRDQREAPVARFEALRHRVAAVYHVRHAPEVPVAFREYVVVQAAMVAAWDIATPAVCDALGRERTMLTGLLAGDVTSLGARWTAAMATAAPHYRATADNLRAVVDAIGRCDTSVVYASPR